MIRKHSVLFTIILAISLFMATPVSAAKSYYAERFDVHIDIQENGSAVITETVAFHFSGDPFTFAFREISKTNTDGITFLDASMDGIPMSQGTGAGQVEVEAGNPLKVTWHFPPTSDAAHVFVVRYRADGVIRKGAADTLIWRAVPEDHEYEIAHTTITLTYPQAATLLEQPALNREHEIARENGRIVVTANGLAEDQDLILTARFSPNSLTQVAPQWQVQQQRADAAMARALPVGLVSVVATVLLGGLGLLVFARAHRRELSLSPVVSNPNPPADISPAIVGKLTGQQHSFMGAVFDLAQRGVLEVHEEKGSWGAKKHVVVLNNHTEPLRPFEQGLLDALFKPGESQINMNEIPARLGAKSKLFDEPLEQELVRRGWLDLERKQKRTFLFGIVILILIFGMIVFILSMFAGGVSLRENTDWLPLFSALIGASIGLFLLSIALLIYAGTYSILTPSGEEQSSRWKGFGEYLKQASKGREPAIRPDYFERYLAYAAVFGLGVGWAKYFKDLGGVPLPVWFHAMAGGKGDFAGMVAVMSASDSAGASAGAGGAAGASGGGASGAG